LRAYLRDLGGAPHQVVGVVVELQLPPGGHLLDVGATEHHPVGETRDEEGMKITIYFPHRIRFP